MDIIPIVPWQLICAERAEVIPVPVTEDGEIDLQALDALLDERVKMVAVNHVSNALGTINPVQEIAAKGTRRGFCMVDGAQAIAHWPLDVQQLAGHIRLDRCLARPALACWGREALLEAMPPFLGGAGMIDRSALRYDIQSPSLQI